MTNESFYYDDKCLVSFHIGELGWALQYHQAFLRHLKTNEYPNHKVIVFCNPNIHVFYNDFVLATIDLPQWFYDLNLDTDCYEAVLPNSEPGSLTPPLVYARLINYFRKHYNKDKAIEVFPPRGCNFFINSCPQLFCRYEVKDSDIKVDKPIIVVFPRARARAPHRNIPDFVWFQLVEALKQNFIVVLAGTPSGACLGDYQDKNVINLINYNEADKTSKVIEYLNLAKCSISSQSGGTHISLLSGCPSYIIGHEKHRHSIAENRLQTPTAFREVQDYRAIDASTIFNDVIEFMNGLDEVQRLNNLDTDAVIQESTEVMENIINDQRTS